MSTLPDLREGAKGQICKINRLSGLDNNGATGILVKNLPVNVEIWKRKEGILFVFIELFLTMIQVGPVLVSEEKTVAKLAAPVHSFAAISDASKKSNWPSYWSVCTFREFFIKLHHNQNWRDPDVLIRALLLIIITTIFMEWLLKYIHIKSN